jgi:RES domain-containing protein
VSSADEEKLARLPPAEFHGIAYRQQSPGFDPTSGAGARRAGGRFNPPNSFPVLYLALSRETAAAELRHAADGVGLPVSSVLPRELFRYGVRLSRVVDLRDETTRTELGVSIEELLAPDRGRSQALGAAVEGSGTEAVVCPSATGAGDILAIFVDNVPATAVKPRLLDTWDVEADVDA